MKTFAGLILIILASGCTKTDPYGTWKAVTILDEHGEKADNSDFGLGWYPCEWEIRPDSTYAIKAEGPLADAGITIVTTNKITLKSNRHKTTTSYAYTRQGNLLTVTSTNRGIQFQRK